MPKHQPKSDSKQWVITDLSIPSAQWDLSSFVSEEEEANKAIIDLPISINKLSEDEVIVSSDFSIEFVSGTGEKNGFIKLAIKAQIRLINISSEEVASSSEFTDDMKDLFIGHARAQVLRIGLEATIPFLLLPLDLR